ILTGYADLDAAVEAINDGQIYKFILKPWNDEELRSTVLRALDHYDLQRENERLLEELKRKNAELEEFNRTLAQKVKERTSIIAQKNLEMGRLNRSLESSLSSVVRVFVNLIELTRPEISRHTRRTASITTILAGRMGLDGERIRDLEIAALLHDIGKVGIPQSLLQREERELSAAERKLVNSHPLIAQNQLSEIEAFKRVGVIIRQHHENWDGSGYPEGISGEAILLESRILSVCNQYDHIYSEGRAQRSPAFLAKYFRTNAGRLFDPKVCEEMLVFLREIQGEEESRRKVEVMPHELRPGMILVNSLKTGRGIFLLPEGQVLKESHIQSIKDINRVDPVESPIEVFVSEI
ncbi:MAG TPA: HD domain-containing protein, partial [Bacteroidetes bacterium]|nr:HD domain-containing protein [Bacteroidota bacterium]